MRARLAQFFNQRREGLPALLDHSQLFSGLRTVTDVGYADQARDLIANALGFNGRVVAKRPGCLRASPDGGGYRLAIIVAG